MRTAIIIQARMGSSRLPGKSMMEIEGKPLLWHVVERARKSRETDVLVVATSTDEKDDRIQEFAESEGIKYYRGDLNDVLDRYYKAAKLFDADIVVRITGDCPLVDPFLIDELVGIFKKNNLDYLSNSEPPLMDGFDVEIFSFKALEDAWKNAEMSSEREHVTPYLRKNEKFKKQHRKNEPGLEEAHCSVDRLEDLELVRMLYSELFKRKKDHIFTYKDVMQILKDRPELPEINKNSIINEGYAKSVREDKKVK
jgi:spore coat polysaccharide biosynthesis protein SpsF